MSEIFRFPNPVNEKVARTVAFVVMDSATITLATSFYWLLIPLAYGFIARVVSGPTLSPLGRLASKVIAPRLGDEKLVPGPPKRFAQAIGATMSTAAAVAVLGFGADEVADVLLAMLILAAGLEFDLRALPRLPAVRGADERRLDSRAGVCRVRRHLDTRRGVTQGRARAGPVYLRFSLRGIGSRGIGSRGIGGSMSFAEINGQRIRYEDSGGDGAPVILAHGFLMDREMFAPQMEALSGEFRVITWDERGFGETEFDGEPFTYWDSAADCLALLDHLGIERAVVGGMSQGGFLSLRAALTAPERVRALVLIDTQAGVEDPQRLARLSPDAGDLAGGGAGGRAAPHGRGR